MQPSIGWSSTSAKDLFVDPSTYTATACSSQEINTAIDDPTDPTGFYGSFRIDGSADFDYAYISAVGDFNADGKNDIAIAAPGYGSNAGGAFVVWGRKNRPWESYIDLNDINF